MKMRGRLSCYVSIVVLCITSILGTSKVCQAESDWDTVKWYAFVTGEVPDLTFKSGETKEITLEISANFQKDIEKIIVGNADIPFAVKGTPKLYHEGNKEEVKYLGKGKYYLKFSLYPRKGAENKTYSLPITFLTSDGGYNTEQSTLLDTVPVTYQSETVEEGKAYLSISNIHCVDVLKVGQTAKVTYTLKNTGSGTAKDISITYDGFSDDGVLPVDKGTTKKIDSLAKNESKSLTFSIKAAQNAVTSAKKMGISVSYQASKTAAERATESESFYIQVKGNAAAKKADGYCKVLISNCKQSVDKPKAGTDVWLSFTMENIGNIDAIDLTIIPTGLSNVTLTPLNHNPNMFIKRLKAGEKKKVSLHYSISEEMESGTFGIEYGFYYNDQLNENHDKNFKLYLKDIQGKKAPNSKGVPKLIIKQYTTGKDCVTAGSKFTFGFDIANTHSTVSADNIKVTITSDEAGTFSVAKGSNSFYISTIGAQKSVHKEIPMKVKADSTTKAYPLKVDFEYEYKGMTKSETTPATGITVSETLSIQVEEDSRPALTNVTPGGYGELVTGLTNSVTFDFTNRGKSPLYNVEVKISGDFQSIQEAYFIGTVEAGTGTSHEMEITPLVEGTGTGIITVTYEDSNGKRGKLKQKFTGEITGDGSGTIEEEGMEPEMPGEGDEGQAKQPIVSLPVFLVIQAILFAGSAVLVRMLVIKRYRKRKLMEEEQEL